MGQTTDSAELAAGLESENAESLGNDDLLGLVVGRGDTLEDLKALESSGTTGSLVGDHATDGLVEDSGRSAEVEGTYIESMTVVQCSGNGFDSPPRVGLYRVIFRRWAWYLTVVIISLVVPQTASLWCLSHRMLGHISRVCGIVG